MKFLNTKPQKISTRRQQTPKTQIFNGKNQIPPFQSGVQIRPINIGIHVYHFWGTFFICF